MLGSWGLFTSKTKLINLITGFSDLISGFPEKRNYSHKEIEPLIRDNFVLRRTGKLPTRYINNNSLQIHTLIHKERPATKSNKPVVS